MKKAGNGYNRKALEAQSLDVINKYKLIFISDIIPYLPCTRATFYNAGLDKLDTIKGALEKNRIDLKVQLRHKWFKSESPALQISLMKLIGTDEEVSRLNGSRTQTEVTFSEGVKVIKWGKIEPRVSN